MAKPELIRVRNADGSVSLKTKAEVDQMFEGFLARLQGQGCEIVRLDRPVCKTY